MLDASLVWVYIFGGCFFRLRRHSDDPAVAVEWASHSIRLNAVAPCYYDTNPNRECFVNDPVLYGTILVQIPLHKLGNLDELSRLILHPASSDLDYMTGSTITIDGVQSEGENEKDGPAQGLSEERRLIPASDRVRSPCYDEWR